jgi:hypothetical protein
MRKISYSLQQLFNKNIKSSFIKKELSVDNLDDIIDFISLDNEVFVFNQDEYRVYSDYQSFFLVTKDFNPFYLIATIEPSVYLTDDVGIICFTGHEQLQLLNLNTLKLKNKSTR